MKSTLLQYALKHIWCSPEADRQAILKPARLTPLIGKTRRLKITLEEVTLPTLNDEYHVFQIGQIPTPIFGIDLTIPVEWTTLEDICNGDVLIANVYTDSGIEYPKTLVFGLLTREKNLVLAIKNTPAIADLRTEDIYVRFYSNRFFMTDRSTVNEDPIKITSRKITGDEDRLYLFNTYNELKVLEGDVRFIQNGFMTEMPGIMGLADDDYGEIIYDSSVYRIIDYPVGDLSTYTSELDTQNKYLVHPPKDTLDIDSIFFRDDLDMYLLAEIDGKVKGIYLHHNKEEANRMVTHKDISIPTSTVEQQALNLGVSPDSCTIRIYYRHSAYERPIVMDTNFIPELYKLDDDQIIDAMTGHIAGPENFSAPFLESSTFTKIMRSSAKTIDGDMAFDALGYGASTEILLDSPVKVTNGEQVHTPSAFIESAFHVVQAHDADMIAFNYDNTSTNILDPGIHRGIYHFIPAHEDERDQAHIDQQTVDIPEDCSYVCYRAIKQSGTRTGEWVNVTNTALYNVEDGELRWTVDHNLYATAVVMNTYNSYVVQPVTDIRSLVMDIPKQTEFLGDVVPVGDELFSLGAYTLIDGIDYISNGTSFVITNKALALDSTTRSLHMLRYGNVDCIPRKEIGFVQWRGLSYNNSYNIHGGSRVHALCNGKLLAKEDLKFVEDSTEATEIPNGSPYVLNYYRGPIANIPWTEVKAERTKYDTKVSAIEPYLTEKLPEYGHENPSAIEGLYELYSPFLDTVIQAIDSGELSLPNVRLTNENLEPYLAPYLPLLDFDPTKSDYYNESYIIVHPTASANIYLVEEHEYYFLKQIIENWLEDKVSLTNFVGIK